MGKDDQKTYRVIDLAHRSEVPPKIVRDLFDTILAIMEEGDKVTIYGFGQFSPSIKRRASKTTRVMGLSMSEVLAREWEL